MKLLSKLLFVMIALTGCVSPSQNIHSAIDNEKAYNAVTDDFIDTPAAPATLQQLTIISGGKKMNGAIYLASGKGPHPTAIFFHGYPGNERNSDIMQALRRNGFNVLFFHYRGAWGSEGDFSINNMTMDAQQVIAFAKQKDIAAQYRIDPTRISVIGHSMGGFAALYTGANDRSVQCTLAISPANLANFAHLVVNAQGELLVPWLAQPQTALKGYNLWGDMQTMGDSIKRYQLENKMSAFANRNLMIIAAKNDRVTPLVTTQTLLKEIPTSANANFTLLNTSHNYPDRRMTLMSEINQWMSDHCR
jgi:pimeloyl-ACP methyl ester carboxylesterase